VCYWWRFPSPWGRVRPCPGAGRPMSAAQQAVEAALGREARPAQAGRCWAGRAAPARGRVTAAARDLSPGKSVQARARPLAAAEAHCAITLVQLAAPPRIALERRPWIEREHPGEAGGGQPPARGRTPPCLHDLDVTETERSSAARRGWDRTRPKPPPSGGIPMGRLDSKANVRPSACTRTRRRGEKRLQQENFAALFFAMKARTQQPGPRSRRPPSPPPPPTTSGRAAGAASSPAST
jgi:hypothetical protein